MKIVVTVRTNKVGSKCERVIEVDDDTSEDDLEDIAMVIMFEMIEWNWKKQL